MTALSSIIEKPLQQNDKKIMLISNKFTFYLCRKKEEENLWIEKNYYTLVLI